MPKECPGAFFGAVEGTWAFQPIGAPARPAPSRYVAAYRIPAPLQYHLQYPLQYPVLTLSLSVPGTTKHVRRPVVQARQADPWTLVEQRRSGRMLLPLPEGRAQDQGAARGTDPGPPVQGRPQRARILVQLDQVL